MNKENTMMRWTKRTIFALIVHALITAIIWAVVMGLWLASNGIYESKALQFGVLAILALPFILDIPAIFALTKIDTVKRFLA
ncbi:MAG TPA: hypothetical protein VJ952_02450 [Opitutales bacterium]|nr:hypothetical protein [Opitutales bacterium]